MRARRRNLVVWSSSAVPADKPSTRIRRHRGWLRTSGLLMIIGMLRLARTARARWEPLFLLAGVALTVTGVMMSAVAAFFAGLGVLIVTLLKGIASNHRDPEECCTGKSPHF